MNIRTEIQILTCPCTASNPAPSSHIPVGLNFLFPNFESNEQQPEPQMGGGGGAYI